MYDESEKLEFDFVVEEDDEEDFDNYEAQGVEYFDFPVNSPQIFPIHQHLADDVRIARKKFHSCEEELGVPAVQLEETKLPLNCFTAVRLTFSFKDISEHLQKLWDLDDTIAIIVDVDKIHRSLFRSYNQLPEVKVSKYNSESEEFFIVGEQIKNLALKICRTKFIRPSSEAPLEIGSFFADLYEQVVERMTCLSEFCVSCGERYLGGGVLPSICNRDLCQHQYGALGLLDGMSVPRVTPDVMSLLIFAFASANVAERWQDTLVPWPPSRLVAALKEARKTSLADGKSQFDKKENVQEMLSKIIEGLPCPMSFLKSVAAFQSFRTEHPATANLLNWLVNSCRSHMERVPIRMACRAFYTDMQYCFVSDKQAKQAEFDELVHTNGGKTRFFFHCGSSADNCHSIIRNDLDTICGQKYTLFRAAYGNGIFLTPILDVAIRYAGGFFPPVPPDGTVARPIRKHCSDLRCCETEVLEDLVCVTLVEVVDRPDVVKEVMTGMFVTDDVKWCIIRMLLLYKDNDIQLLHNAMDAAYGEYERETSIRLSTASYMPMPTSLSQVGFGGAEASAKHVAVIKCHHSGEACSSRLQPNKVEEPMRSATAATAGAGLPDPNVATIPKGASHQQEEPPLSRPPLVQRVPLMWRSVDELRETALRVEAMLSLKRQRADPSNVDYLRQITVQRHATQRLQARIWLRQRRNMPGDLTVISEDKLAEIHAVVHMFRNSSLMERVHRHLHSEYMEGKQDWALPPKL